MLTRSKGAPMPSETTCIHCGEAITCGDLSLGRVHHECFVRMVRGGANHMDGTCTCCGGDQPPDPPGLTKREAARLSVLKLR